jgi:hypothetical protein
LAAGPGIFRSGFPETPFWGIPENLENMLPIKGAIATMIIHLGAGFC